MTDGSLWDRLPPWGKVLLVATATLYFGAGLIAPLFWPAA